MRAVFFLFCSSIVLFSVTTVSAANKDIKKTIFVSCEDSVNLLDSLAIEKRSEFIEYLEKVMVLPWDFSSDLPLGDLPGGGAVSQAGVTLPTGTGISHSELWKTLSPERNLRAKRCVLTLTSKLLPESVTVLPALVTFLNDPLIPEDLHRDVQNSILTLTQIAKDTIGLVLPPRFFLELLKSAEKDSSFYALYVLTELRDRSVPAIMAQFSKSSSERRKSIAKLLKQIDPAGTHVEEILILFFASADDSLRRDALSLSENFPELSVNVFSSYVQLLQDVSPEVQARAIEALNISLGNRGKTQADFPLASLNTVFSMFAGSSPEMRNALAKVMQVFGEQSPDYITTLQRFAENSDSEVRRLAILLMSQVKELSPVIITTISRALYDRAQSVRLSAIYALSFAKNQNKTIMTAYGKFLSSIQNEVDVDFRHKAILQVADAVERLQPKGFTSSLIPYFVEAMGFDKNYTLVTLPLTSHAVPISNKFHPAVAALLKLDKEPLSTVRRAMSEGSSLFQLRALDYLANQPTVERYTVEAVILMLSARQDVALKAKETMYLLGEGSVLELERNLANPTKLSKKVKKIISQVLLSFSPWNKLALEFLLTNSNDLSCTEMANMSKLFPEPFPLNISSDTEALFKSNLSPIQTKVLDCLVQNQLKPMIFLATVAKLKLISDWLKLPAIGLELTNKLNEILFNEQINPNIRFEIVKSYQNIGLSSETALKALALLIANSPNPIRLRAIEELRLIPGAADKVPDLINIANQESEDNSVQTAAVVTISHLNPETFDAVSYFLDLLRESAEQPEPVWLASISESTFEKLFLKGMEELPTEAQPNLIRATVSYPNLSAVTVPVLITKLSSEQETLRYESTIALTVLSSEEQELPLAFKKIIQSPKAFSLKTETFSLSTRALFEKLAQESSSIFEKELLQEILAKFPPNEVTMPKAQ
jgi:HEAT repeat protein